jgi:hypothetical protein
MEFFSSVGSFSPGGAKKNLQKKVGLLLVYHFQFPCVVFSPGGQKTHTFTIKYRAAIRPELGCPLGQGQAKSL